MQVLKINMKLSRIDEFMIQCFIIDNNLLFDIYALIDDSQWLQHGINLWKCERDGQAKTMPECERKEAEKAKEYSTVTKD